LANDLIQKAAKNNKPAVERPVDRLKMILDAPTVQAQFKSVLAENSGAFVASIIDLYNNDKYLQVCDAKQVVMEALKAASLKLPVNKQLGFAWIVPYKDNKTGTVVPTFQIGYKGYLQLCMRTGAYRHINADCVYEGELVSADKLTGEIVIDTSQRSGDKKVGYFAFIETLNGFRKTLYMSTSEIDEHARKYSKNYNSKFSTWATDFDAMALKTCLRLLLSKYGVMSVEMQSAYVADSSDTVGLADDAITIEAEPMTEEEYSALLQAEQASPSPA
jgi:recombination protein RecT